MSELFDIEPNKSRLVRARSQSSLSSLVPYAISKVLLFVRLIKHLIKSSFQLVKLYY